MSEILFVIILSWVSGITAFIGGLLSYLEGYAETELKKELVHAIVAFGGGILIAAIAFTLTPEAMNVLSPNTLAITFCAGGIVFCILDYIISKFGEKKSQFIAMLLDFIPEALALGALWAYKPKLASLLALFIALQNLPEGFNAFREMYFTKNKTKHIFTILFLVSLIGPICATIGYYYLQDHHTLSGLIMAFASGGILYLIFEDIAPASIMKKHITPPLGAILGFAVGMLGKQLLG